MLLLLKTFQSEGVYVGLTLEGHMSCPYETLCGTFVKVKSIGECLCVLTLSVVWDVCSLGGLSFPSSTEFCEYLTVYTPRIFKCLK